MSNKKGYNSKQRKYSTHEMEVLTFYPINGNFSSKNIKTSLLYQLLILGEISSVRRISTEWFKEPTWKTSTRVLPQSRGSNLTNLIREPLLDSCIPKKNFDTASFVFLTFK